MGFRKHITVANISSILGIISFIFAAITLSKEHLYLLTRTILFPFTEKLNPGLDGSRFTHWLVISIALIFYIFLITMMIKMVKKKKAVHPFLICQEEIASMLDAIDTTQSDQNINEKILMFMEKFNEEVARIFQVSKHEFKSLWVFQLRKEEYVKYVSNQPVPLDLDEKSYLMIVDLEDQSLPTEEEKRIIQWALQQPNPQFWDDRVMENFKGKHREFVFVRNYGEFRLGYALLFKGEGSITTNKLEHFESASSYLMLLGKIDNLTTKMIQYLLKKVV